MRFYISHITMVVFTCTRTIILVENVSKKTSDMHTSLQICFPFIAHLVNPITFITSNISSGVYCGVYHRSILQYRQLYTYIGWDQINHGLNSEVVASGTAGKRLPVDNCAPRRALLITTLLVNVIASVKSNITSIHPSKSRWLLATISPFVW